MGNWWKNWRFVTKKKFICKHFWKARTLPSKYVTFLIQCRQSRKIDGHTQWAEVSIDMPFGEWSGISINVKCHDFNHTIHLLEFILWMPTQKSPKVIMELYLKCPKGSLKISLRWDTVDPQGIMPLWFKLQARGDLQVWLLIIFNTRAQK